MQESYGDEEVARIICTLSEPNTLDLATLNSMWQGRCREHWEKVPEIYRLLGKRIIQTGELVLAYDVVSEGLDFWPLDVILRQQMALTLARIGALERAYDILLTLQREGHINEETLGLLGRVHKGMWALAKEPREKEKHLRAAFAAYEAAFSHTGGYWTGINVAATAMLLDELGRAKNVAKAVQKECLSILKQSSQGNTDAYWILATLGEAALILGEWSEAEAWYYRAAESDGKRFADVSTTRHQARILMDHLGGEKHRFDHCFYIPKIVVFSGHMIDQPGRMRPRFPSQLEQEVFTAILSQLKELKGGFGYSSAACGADILFLEAMLELGGELHIILPFRPELFLKTSVEIQGGAYWTKRFHKVMEKAVEVVIANKQCTRENTLIYEYSNLILDGLALLRSQILQTELIPLVVWDNRIGEQPGGTYSMVKHWNSQSRAVQVINMPPVNPDEECESFLTYPKNVSTNEFETSPDASTLPQKIVAILFADTTGFSKLMDEEVPLFVKEFLGTIAELTCNSPCCPLLKNTWGDALYFVFNTVNEAGMFALELRDRISSTNWAKIGLPAHLNLRIALDAGPVYSYIDPVTQQLNFTGSQTSRAARIETVTPAGYVYASQAFAALSMTQGVKDFACEYVGLIPLQKGYGTFPIYLVRRR